MTSVRLTIAAEIRLEEKAKADKEAAKAAAKLARTDKSNASSPPSSSPPHSSRDSTPALSRIPSRSKSTSRKTSPERGEKTQQMNNLTGSMRTSSVIVTPSLVSATTLDWATISKNEDKLKKTCRTGIPHHQRKEFWRSIITHHCGDNIPPSGIWSQLVHESFNGIPPAHIPAPPDFGSPLSWAHTKHSSLSSSQLLSAKTILCVLALNNIDVTHCPQLVDLICLLIPLYSEEDVFMLVQAMINRSRKDERYFTLTGLRYLRFLKTFHSLMLEKNTDIVKHIKSLVLDPVKIFQSWVDRLFVPYCPGLRYLRFLKTFHSLMLEKNTDMVKHITSLGLDPVKIFQSWVDRLFVPYCSDVVVYRILDCYLNEGNKILFRMGLALFNHHKKQLKKQMKANLFMKEMNALMICDHPDTLLKTAFSIRLSRSTITKISSSHQQFADVPIARDSSFHLPKFMDKSSDCMSLTECYTLWSWLDPDMRIQDPVLLYSGAQHGYSMSTMFARTADTEGPIIMLIKDTSDAVLGFFIPHCWQLSKDDENNKTTKEMFIPQDGRALVFTFRPETRVWRTFAARQHRQEEQRRHRNSFGAMDCKTPDEASPEPSVTSKSAISDLSSRPGLDRQISATSTTSIESYDPDVIKPVTLPPRAHKRNTSIGGSITPGERSPNEKNVLACTTSAPTSPRGTRLIRGSSDAAAIHGGEEDVAILQAAAAATSRIRADSQQKRHSIPSGSPSFLPLPLPLPLPSTSSPPVIDPSHLDNPDVPYLIVSTDQIGIGDRSGYALSLHNNMRTGITNPTLCFDNKRLTRTGGDGTFRVVSIEIYTLHHDVTQTTHTPLARLSMCGGIAPGPTPPLTTTATTTGPTIATLSPSTSISSSLSSSPMSSPSVKSIVSSPSS